jgi:hypothetical protein
MSDSTARNLLFCITLIILGGCAPPDTTDGTSLLGAPIKNTPGVNLNSNFTTVIYNGSIRLDWSTNNVGSCIASGDWSGARGTTGSEIIGTLVADSTFVLTCTGDDGDASDTAIISVGAIASPTVTLSAIPSSIAMNGSSTLRWSSTNATSCTASVDWSGARNPSGFANQNNLTSDKTYTLICSGPGGSASDSASVSVAATPTTPTLNISASPSQVAYNGSTTLSWSTVGVDTCNASGSWTGNRNTSGSTSNSNLTASQTYTLTCNGAGGTVTDSATVTVAAQSPTLTFSASPTSVSQNGSTTLNWSTTDATGCTASGDWSGSKGGSGSEMINSMLIDSQFTLDCSGAGGTVNDTVNVAVVLSNNGTALLSWVPPTENTDGSTLTDLAGYKVYYGTSSGSYGAPITINDPGLSSYMVENLGISDWFFVMKAFNSSGMESSYSTEISKTIN